MQHATACKGVALHAACCRPWPTNPWICILSDQAPGRLVRHSKGSSQQYIASRLNQGVIDAAAAPVSTGNGGMIRPLQLAGQVVCSCVSRVAVCRPVASMGSLMSICSLLCRASRHRLRPCCCYRAPSAAAWSATAQRNPRPLCAPFRSAPAEGMSRRPAVSGRCHHLCRQNVCSLACGPTLYNVLPCREHVLPDSLVRSALLPTMTHDYTVASMLTFL